MTVARRPFLGKVGKHLLLLPFLVFALFPFYHMTLTSLKTDRELYDRHAVPLVITQGPTLEHYSKLLWDTEFLTWTKNSLLVTGLSTLVSVVLGTIAAYALARLKFAGAAALGTGIFVTYLVPTSLLFLPLAQIINWIGMGDSKWALVLTYPTFLVPLHLAPDRTSAPCPRRWRSARWSTGPPASRPSGASCCPSRCPASCARRCSP